MVVHILTNYMIFCLSSVCEIMLTCSSASSLTLRKWKVIPESVTETVFFSFRTKIFIFSLSVVSFYEFRQQKQVCWNYPMIVIERVILLPYVASYTEECFRRQNSPSRCAWRVYIDNMPDFIDLCVHMEVHLDHHGMLLFYMRYKTLRRQWNMFNGFHCT